MRNQRDDGRSQRIWRVAVACGLLGSALAAEEVNRIVLRINDEIATLHDYELRKSGEIARILGDPSIPSGDQQDLLKEVGREVMTSLFGELLLLSYAEQQGIRVSNRDVDEALVEMQRQRGIENQQQFEQALAAAGMTVEDLRSSVRRELIWNQVIGREVQAQIEISDEEIRAYYRNNSAQFLDPEQRWLQEIIVLESSERDEDELRSLVSRIFDEIGTNGDLEEVAATYQKDGITTGVIDLGWLKSDEIGAELAEVAWELEPGGLSRPIAARGGYHILRVVEVREAQERPLEEVKGWIDRRLRGERFNQDLRKFMAEIEQQAYVREDLPPDAVGYRKMSEGLEFDDELDIFHAPVTGGRGGEPDQAADPADAG